ncbi:hypothetical protein PRUPE_7G190100 [Prunus persica]|uniref:Protein kinase domain-containing protein n=1 Tax=Prunus persica TaxID=3760 RepID=A0A251NDR7_PRUPE|nr:hypothetical protein PRUPE_7G190100 [Prunus persica]
MEKQQASVDGIQKEHKHKLNPDKDLLVKRGRIIIQYEFDYDPSRIYSTGKIYFKNGKEEEARFFKYEKSEEDLAKKIFTLTSKLASKLGDYEPLHVLKPHFLTYYEPQNIWILCYEKFDHLLSEIKMDVEDSVDGPRILSFWWRDSIRDVLRTIKYIHSHNMFHNGLNETYNYAVVSGQIKIINVRSNVKDLEDPVHPSELQALRIKDLIAFRNMLKEKIMLPKVPWADRDYFFAFFDKEEELYPIFVEKLASHPFLLTPAERMECFSNIRKSAFASNNFKRILNGRTFLKYRNWNREDMAREFQKVYKRSNSKYNCECVWDLLEFLRDIYLDLPCNMKAVDAEVKRLYPNFLNEIFAID